MFQEARALSARRDEDCVEVDLEFTARTTIRVPIEEFEFWRDEVGKGPRTPCPLTAVPIERYADAVMDQIKRNSKTA